MEQCTVEDGCSFTLLCCSCVHQKSTCKFVLFARLFSEGLVNHEKSGFGLEDGRGKGEQIMLSRVDSIELEESDHEELLDEQDRITGALQIGVVQLRRRASWVSLVLNVLKF